MNINCPDRSLSTEDPNFDSILPVYDRTFEDGVSLNLSTQSHAH